MKQEKEISSPISLFALGSAPLEPFDLLGRHKIVALGLTNESPEAEVQRAAHSAFARIERNHFKFKSLSCWSYNIAVGCRHGCRFCYVPDSQQTGPGKKKENTGPLATVLRGFGVLDPDADWGKYVLFRPWDEQRFLASLAKAENTPPEELNPDGNRAIILCSTTDPYQTVSIPGNPTKQKLLNDHCRFLVRRALELILKHSTLNVRILTRSPLAEQDFDLYKQFGSRLLFGMSLPTLRNGLARVYEPNAPAPSQRLATLQAAKEAGIHIYVAMAPTYPECDKEDLQATLEAIRPLDPLTVFHEPINIRAENVERIATHAAALNPPVKLQTEVFADPSSWRRYAREQLCTVQMIAGKLGMLHLHLWPDQCLKSKRAFFDTWGSKEGDAEYQTFANWLSFWHTRKSEWPAPNNTAQTSELSTLSTSEFAPLELVGHDNLSAEDRSFLEQREQIIEVHRKTFLEVGNALTDTVADNRVTALQLASESNTLVDYTYVGLAWQVLVGYAGPAVELTYIQQSGEPVGDAGDPYNGYDRFGRTVDVRWQSTNTGNAQLERLQYGFDRDSRRTWRQRLLTTGLDNAYNYDGLSQVTNAAVGNLNLNHTAISSIPAQNEAWDYDPTGNWNVYQTQENGAVTLDQTRVYDKGNRLTQISNDPRPIIQDQVGRMLQVSPDATGDWTQSLIMQWDAWSRIVQISRNDNVIGSYTYDGLSRRLTKATGGVTLHTYYSDTWRPLEERIDPQTTAVAQYFWGARHRDDLVRRDRATTSGGSLDETRYVLMEYFSPAAITDENGTVTERYAFSTFGNRSILAPDFAPITSSECAWDFAFQGQFLDAESGLVDYGYRYYSPSLGRWLSRDPIAERGGMNLYGYVGNSPTNRVDSLGLLGPPIQGGFRPANGPWNSYDTAALLAPAIVPAIFTPIGFTLLLIAAMISEQNKQYCGKQPIMNQPTPPGPGPNGPPPSAQDGGGGGDSGGGGDGGTNVPPNQPGGPTGSPLQGGNVPPSPYGPYIHTNPGNPNTPYNPSGPGPSPAPVPEPEVEPVEVP